MPEELLDVNDVRGMLVQAGCEVTGGQSVRHDADTGLLATAARTPRGSRLFTRAAAEAYVRLRLKLGSLRGLSTSELARRRALA